LHSGVPTSGVCWDPVRSYRILNFPFSAVTTRIGTPDSNHFPMDRHTGYVECDNEHTVRFTDFSSRDTKLESGDEHM
jgi:hypothetical protein